MHQWILSGCKVFLTFFERMKISVLFRVKYFFQKIKKLIVWVLKKLGNFTSGTSVLKVRIHPGTRMRLNASMSRVVPSCFVGSAWRMLATGTKTSLCLWRIWITVFVAGKQDGSFGIPRAVSCFTSTMAVLRKNFVISFAREIAFFL